MIGYERHRRARWARASFVAAAVLSIVSSAAPAAADSAAADPGETWKEQVWIFKPACRTVEPTRRCITQWRSLGEAFARPVTSVRSTCALAPETRPGKCSTDPASAKNGGVGGDYWQTPLLLFGRVGQELALAKAARGEEEPASSTEDGDAGAAPATSVETVAPGVAAAARDKSVSDHEYFDGGSKPGLTGTLESAPFVVDRRYLAFALGGGGGAATSFELWTRCDPQTSFAAVLVDHGPGVPGFERKAWDLSLFKGCEAKIVVRQTAALDAPGQLGSLMLDEVELTSEAPLQQAAPVWGMADLHVHLFAHLGLGGRFFTGAVEPEPETCPMNDDACRKRKEACLADPKCALKEAVGDCGSAHGRAMTKSGVLTMAVNHGRDGYPTFDAWPRYDDLLHQRLATEWLRRAHRGGLRLILMDVLNSHSAAACYQGNSEEGKPPLPPDDVSATELQVDAAWRFAKRHSDWVGIARTPQEARRLIGMGKMAMVLGLEVDALNNFSNEEMLRNALRTDPTALTGYLDRMYRRGVRHIFPIHLLNNAFGGAAVFDIHWDDITLRAAKSRMHMRNGFLMPGVRYRIDRDGDFMEGLMSALMNFDLRSVPSDSDHALTGLAHVNADGLSGYGRVLVQEAICRGFLVDVDHMGDAAAEETIALAEGLQGKLGVPVPVISGHTSIRELGFGVRAKTSFEPSNEEYRTSRPSRLASERLRTEKQMGRIVALGGVVGLGVATGGVDADDMAEHCDGTSQTFKKLYRRALSRMGDEGIAFGTDSNGFAPYGGPRFGTLACSGPNGDDEQRVKLVAAQAAAQRNGVVYGRPVGSPTRKGHFEGELVEKDGTARRIWRALVALELGWPKGGPGMSDHDLVKECKVETDGRIHCKPCEPGAPRKQGDERLCRVLRDFHRMREGNNVPLVPSEAGERVFDVNLDGMAHYGLMPDFVQDLRNVGVSPDELQALMYGAEDFIRAWERVDFAAARLRAGSDDTGLYRCKAD